jgi:putative transposase
MPGRLRRHDEFGHIHFLTVSCFRRLQFFRHDSVKLSFIRAMDDVRAKHGVRWLGYVVMPEHVHVLVLPQSLGGDQVTPISVVLHDLKQRAGHGGKEALRAVWRERRSLGTSALDGWATGPGPKPFWKPRGYDFNVVAEEKILEKLDYMHCNPVTRSLVDRPEQWRWSSYRFYELDDDSLIAMDWDGALPLTL